MSKLTGDQFNDLQRWQKVRDECTRALSGIDSALYYAGSTCFDRTKVNDSRKWLNELRDKACVCISNHVKVEE